MKVDTKPQVLPIAVSEVFQVLPTVNLFHLHANTDSRFSLAFARGPDFDQQSRVPHSLHAQSVYAWILNPWAVHSLKGWEVK